MRKNKFVIGISLLFVVLLIGFTSAYSVSNPNYGLFDSYGAGSSEGRCEAGQDFLVQIAPFGCTPSVVRSDLLEEQNVPVFCQLGATKMNPLIDVEVIEGISFSGEYPPEVSGIGFHPAKAVLGVSGDLNNPVLNNIGYAVIVLKKQPKESEMPEYVSGNLTARLRYDIQNAFGIGKAVFYLPQLESSEWEDKKNQYSFWNGKGYLKAEEVGTNDAVISIYNDLQKISTARLTPGESSKQIPIPGFDCIASMKLRLDGLEAPDTRARLEINGEIVEVADEEKFLENRCRVKNIEKNGLNQKVELYCKEDSDGFLKGNTFELSISPRVELKIEDEVKEYGVGDYLYNYKVNYGGLLEEFLEPTVDQIDSTTDEAKEVIIDVGTAMDELITIVDSKKGQVITDAQREEFYASNEVEVLMKRISGDIDIVQKVYFDLGVKLDPLWRLLENQAELYSTYYEEVWDKQKGIYGDYYAPSVQMIKKDVAGVESDISALKDITLEPVSGVQTPQLDEYSDNLKESKRDLVKMLLENTEKLKSQGSSLNNNLKNSLRKLLDKEVEKFVYLGYVGTTDNSYDKNKLYVRLVAIPQKKDKLSDEEIVHMTNLDSYGRRSTTITGANAVTGVGIANIGLAALNTYAKAGTRVYDWFNGKTDETLSYKEGIQEKFGKEISITGFAGPKDKNWALLAETGSVNAKKISENYENAKQDYDYIIDAYPSEEFSDKTTYGEEALYKKIVLTDSLNQKKTVIELCDKFKEEYPESGTNLNKYCNDESRLSSIEIATSDVIINGDIKTISFDGIYEPDFNEYGATIIVRSPDGISEELLLKKNEMIILDASSNDFIQLLDIEEDYATLKINLKAEGILESIKRSTISNANKRLEKGVTESFGSGYLFALKNINLEKSAKVSIIPNINNAGTTADFSFNIGIEKRAIQLSPEKTQEKIDNLGETILKWEDKSENLGTIVKGLKGVCLATGATLTIKNFLDNSFGGGANAIARQKVMRGDGGYYDQCSDLVTSKEYISIEQCLNEKAPDIDADVKRVSDLITNENTLIKSLQKNCVSKENPITGEIIYNTDCFKKNYLENSKDKLGESIVGVFGSDSITINNEQINLNEFVNNLDSTKISTGDLKDLVLYSKEGGSLSNDRLREIVGDIHMNTKSEVELQTFKDRTGYSEHTGMVTSKELDEVSIKNYLKFGDIKETYTHPGTIEIKDTENVYFIKNKATGKEHAVIYDDDGTVIRTYSLDEAINHMRIYEGDDLGEDKISDANPLGLEFKKYDEGSYHNTFKSSSGSTKRVLRYYETEPYKGVPAMVPFDLENGWYAHLKQTLPVGKGIAPVDSSGRVSSFYLCNVGKNEREENMGGDDICRMTNLYTGQPYKQFPGISNEGDVGKLVDCAIDAINDASREYKSGVREVSISTSCDNFRISVGSPYADIPDMQCQDFMSPKDCNLLFNVCDPVICPSSRCDFGGRYPVKDVIQSGIIGSVALCLPNWKEGIKVPVCLSGIKAGIDGYLSVLNAHQDCLQDSLDNGEMVGICDEIYSIHLCEFFWRQGLPFANMILPKALEWALGQNVRGGGEYLGVASAWEAASNSVDYFTQYYASNSFKAFKSRTTEEAGGEVCKNFASGVYPSGGNVLDTLTDPDSPPQFHGRFDEIPFTTATVPPVSHYKVFYHIYAGDDSRAYYQVYLTAGPESSYYQDTSLRKIVDSGYISRGDTVSETKDFTSPSGYKEMCIRVNDQVECGFKQASTSYAVNYVTDKYMEEQASEIDVKSEAECISGSASVYSLLNPNLQEGVGDAINPEIYNRGIIRICATDNPGKGTDNKVGTDEGRWMEVGICDDRNVKCWLDRESVENVIKDTEIENRTLRDLTEKQLKILGNTEGYLNREEVKEEISNIKDEKNNSKQISLINNIIEKVFWNGEKAELLFLRAQAYGNIAIELFSKIKPKEVDTGKTPEDESVEGITEKDCEPGCKSRGEDVLGEFVRFSECGDKGVIVSFSGTGGDEGCCCYREEESVTGEEEDEEEDEVKVQTIEFLNEIKRTEVELKEYVKDYSDCGDYARLIIEAAERENIPDPVFLMALMIHESYSYNEGKYCDVNDVTDESYGLMQLTNRTVDVLCVDEVEGIKSFEDIKGQGNVKNNIDCGAKILKYYYDKNKYGRQFERACSEEYKKILYKEWAAALRGYNGWGCNSEYPNQDQFVDYVEVAYKKLLEGVVVNPEKEISIPEEGAVPESDSGNCEITDAVWVDKNFEILDEVSPKTTPGDIYIGLETNSISNCEGYYVSIYETIFGGDSTEFSVKKGVFKEITRGYYISEGVHYKVSLKKINFLNYDPNEYKFTIYDPNGKKVVDSYELTVDTFYSF